MFDILDTVVTGVLSGGATGLIGVALQQWGDRAKRRDDLERLKLEHQQTRELAEQDRKHELALANLNADSAERIATLQASVRIEESADLNYRASLDADRASYLSPAAQQSSRAGRWLMAAVDFLRGVIRPGVTAYSLVLLTMLFHWVQSLWNKTGMQLPPDQIMRLTMEIIGTVTYLATTCTVWWFGVRPAQRK